MQTTDPRSNLAYDFKRSTRFAPNSNLFTFEMPRRNRRYSANTLF